MRLPLLLILCASLLFITNCKRDKEDCFDPTNPQCKNYDPCYGQKPVTADIEISQREELGVLIGEKVLYMKDEETFPKGSLLHFHCPLDGAKYTWVLGAETITNQTFERNFYTTPYGEYSVKLVVQKAPNKNCFPADNGIDTFIKKFNIVPVCSLAMTGVFKGKWDNLQLDSSLVSLRLYTDYNWTDSCSQLSFFRFTNLKGTNDTFSASRNDVKISNTELISRNSPNSHIIDNAKFKINLENDTVLFDYFIASKHYIFRGRKIAN